MADEGGIYAEDIVKNSHGTLGLVVQDAEETSDDSDSEDEVLKKGQLLVSWYPTGNEETILISKVQLADRSLLPGDVVKHADPNTSKQKGYIGDVEVVASVKVLAANQVVKNVDCRELEPLQELLPGVHVTLGPWLGIVKEANQRLTLKTKNGSRCCIEGEQTEMLYDMSDQRDEDSPFYSEAFYPGQVVAGPSKVFKEAKWLSGVKPIIHSQSQMRGTVEEVKVISCEVNWQICGACPGEEFGVLMQPDATVTEDQLSRLTVVNHYRHASIQIGDKAFYTVKAKDLELAAKSHGGNTSSLTPLPIGQDHAQRPNPGQAENSLSPLSDHALEEEGSWQEENKKAHPQRVVSDSTDADDDGEGGEHTGHKSKSAHSQGPKHDSSTGAPSTRFPVKRRRKRAKRKRKPLPHMEVKVGDKVCVEITSTCTTVDVIWQDRSKETGIPSTDLTPVFHLDEHEFFPGDYVNDKRVTADATKYGTVLTTNFASRTCDVKWFTREGTELSVERDVSVYDIAEHTDFVFNSGDIVVRMVPPDYCTSPLAAAPTPSTPCVGQVTNVDEHGNVFIRWVDETESHVIPQELYKVDTEDDNQSIEIADDSQNNSDDEWETASDVSSDEASPDHDDIITDNSSPHGDEEGREEENDTESKEQVDLNVLNEMLSNKNPAFMILGAVPEDHAFKITTFYPGNRRKIMSVIQKELSLLHSSLPSGILVRSFEDRVDLYRVMITGPPGTPYEHGLFLFDVKLPADYSSSPPVFHYISMCSGRLNPNLYEDGKVCVSLLGTWTGKGSEVWTPKSSVLQVLISIQGLILCSEPYYNEAGYEKQRGSREGRENSRLYNEMVILKVLQSMATMIARPPSGFETEIRAHFVENMSKLLQKINFWLEHNKTLTTTEEETCNGVHGNEVAMTQEDRQVVKDEKKMEEQKPQEDQPTAKIPQEDQSTSKTPQEAQPRRNIPQEEQNGSAKESAEGKQTGAIAKQGTESCQTSASNQTSQPQGAQASSNDPFKLPEYPLFPLSKGFRKSLEGCLQQLKTATEAQNLSSCISIEKVLKNL